MSDSELRVTWRENLVVASCLLCAQATYAALLVLQMRHSWLTGLLGSLCLSVGASWCVSVLLHAAMQVDIGITYHLGWSMLAVAVEASCTFAALAVVDRKVPRAVEVAAGVSSLRAHVAVVKRAPWRWLLSAGLLIAAGMLGRHCLSLVALQTDASVAVDYGKAGIFFALAYLHALVFINLSFVLPAARRRTSPAALVAAAILCATIFQAQSSVLFRSDAPHLQSGARATYLRAIQTSFLGLTVCFVSVAYAGYLFKAKLSRAMTQATEAATHIANGDYSALSKEVKKLGDGNDVDPSATALRAAYVSMGAQLHRLKTFLPPAFLASLAERMEAEDEPLTTGECDPREDKPGHSGGRRSTVSSILFSHRSSRSNSSRSLGTVSSACSMVIEELGMPGTQHSSRKVAIVAFNLRDFHDLFDDFAGLAEYQQKALDLLSHCTTSNRGIVDMFQGDHACCTFNAVRTSPAHTTKAVTMLSMFNEACGSTLRKAASFGISNGTCVVGFFGTSNMKRFNVIGPAYGQAFVLESLCRQYKAVSNLLPSCVYDEVDSLMPGRCVDVVSLPGYPAPSVVMTLSFTGRASTGDSWMYDLRGPRADAAVRGIYELYAGEQEAAAKEMYEGCGTMAFDPAAVAMLDKPVAEHAGRDQGRFYVLSILKQDRPEFCYQRPVSEDPVSPALAAKRSIRSRLSTNRASSQLSLLTPSEAATNRFKPIHSASASSLFSHTSGGWQNPKLSQQAGKLLTSPKLMAPRLSQSSSQPSLVSQSTASFRWQSQTGVLLSPGSPAGGETTVRTSLTLSSRSSIQTHSSNKPSQGLDAMHLQPDYPRQPHIHEPQQQQQQQQQQQARCSLESSSEPGAQVMQSSDGSESSTPSVRSFIHNRISRKQHSRRNPKCKHSGVKSVGITFHTHSTDDRNTTSTTNSNTNNKVNTNKSNINNPLFRPHRFLCFFVHHSRAPYNWRLSTGQKHRLQDKSFRHPAHWWTTAANTIKNNINNQGKTNSAKATANKSNSN
eukprot:gene20218-31087_t